MKLFSALIALLSSTVAANQAQYIKRLVSNAVPTENSQLGRHLDQEEYRVDISNYSIKFEKCQFVKSYDDELAQSYSGTVLATKRFVLFRLCPSDCSSCNYNYGEYLVDLESYLEATVEYFQGYQEAMCEACNQVCEAEAQANQYQNADANGQDQAAENNGGRKLKENHNYNFDSLQCSSCYTECQKIENMEANGYYDATNFLECQVIYDPEDDNRAPLYAGPICASSGTRIKIGVFTDQYCLQLDSTKEVDDYLVGENGQMKLSHALLKNTYTNTCISCLEPANNNNQGNDANDADQVLEICENLYEASAKCEKTHGFESGYASYYGYENQLSQEETVCDFMSSLKSGTYDEQGEIIVSGANSSVRSDSTTGGQKFALTFFILGTVGLAVYAAMLHSKLVKGSASLSSSGGAMA